jgi:hypothetical protein
MTRLVKLTIFASALALAGLGASTLATADKLPRQCIDCVPGNGGNGGPPGGGNNQNEDNQGGHHHQQGQPNGESGPDQGNGTQHRRKFQPDDQPGAYNNGPDQEIPRHSRKYHPNDQFQQGGGDGGMDQRPHAENHKWHYDPHHHHRQNHRDSHFRFYFGGYWYPEPYWDEPDYSYDDDYSDPYDVSCREGADIVSERFARVRILDCGGRVYTYLGRRYGDTFEIVVSPRTGRILDAHRI